MILPQKTLFQNIKIKLNSNAWMTLKSSVVIFQALKPLQPQWPQWPQQPQWPQWPRQPHFIKKITDPDGLIIPSTQMTNTSPFLWNGSSKIQFFTDIWYTFCPRLVRPACVTFLKTGWWNSNAPHSGYQNHLKTNSSLRISICQTQFKKDVSIWDTLYIGTQKLKMGLFADKFCFNLKPCCLKIKV